MLSHAHLLLLVSLLLCAFFKCEALHINATLVTLKTLSSIDSVEATALKIADFTRSHRQGLRSAIGVCLLLYGGYFANTLVFLQALAVTGWPVFNRMFNELKIAYVKTRAIIRNDLHDIVGAMEDYADLVDRIKKKQESLEHAKISLKKRKMKNDEFATFRNLTQSEIKSLQVSLSKVHAVQSFTTHLKAAIDPTKLKDLFGAVYHSIIIGLASVSSQLLATITTGFGIGKTVYGRVSRYLDHAHLNNHIIAENREARHLLESTTEFMCTHADWVKTAVQIICKTAGVAFAFVTDNAMSLYSACALGSDLLLDAVEDSLDPTLHALGLPTIRSSPRGVMALHALLIATGVRVQLLPGHHVRMPAFIKWLLGPVIAVEEFLSRLSIANFLSIE